MACEPQPSSPHCVGVSTYRHWVPPPHAAGHAALPAQPTVHGTPPARMRAPSIHPAAAAPHQEPPLPPPLPLHCRLPAQPPRSCSRGGRRGEVRGRPHGRCARAPQQAHRARPGAAGFAAAGAAGRTAPAGAAIDPAHAAAPAGAIRGGRWAAGVEAGAAAGPGWRHRRPRAAAMWCPPPAPAPAAEFAGGPLLNRA